MEKTGKKFSIRSGQRIAKMAGCRCSLPLLCGCYAIGQDNHSNVISCCDGSACIGSPNDTNSFTCRPTRTIASECDTGRCVAITGLDVKVRADEAYCS